MGLSVNGWYRSSSSKTETSDGSTRGAWRRAPSDASGLATRTPDSVPDGLGRAGALPQGASRPPPDVPLQRPAESRVPRLASTVPARRRRPPGAMVPRGEAPPLRARVRLRSDRGARSTRFATAESRARFFHRRTGEDPYVPPCTTGLLQRSADLPKSVREALPRQAQTIYRKAFNNAWQEYGSRMKRRRGASREETAHRVAWAAVKTSYEKRGGRWAEIP